MDWNLNSDISNRKAYGSHDTESIHNENNLLEQYQVYNYGCQMIGQLAIVIMFPPLLLVYMGSLIASWLHI